MLHENPAGDIAAQSALADDIDRFSRLQLSQTFPELIHRNVDKAVDMAAAKFFFRPRIQKDSASVHGKRIKLIPEKLL